MEKPSPSLINLRTCIPHFPSVSPVHPRRASFNLYSIANDDDERLLLSMKGEELYSRAGEHFVTKVRFADGSEANPVMTIATRTRQSSVASTTKSASKASFCVL